MIAYDLDCESVEVRDPEAEPDLSMCASPQHFAHGVLVSEGLREAFPLLHVAHKYEHFFPCSCEANLSIVLKRPLIFLDRDQ